MTEDNRSKISCFKRQRRECDKKREYEEKQRLHEENIKQRECERAYYKKFREWEKKRLDKYYESKELIRSEVARIGDILIDRDHERRYQQQNREEEKQRLEKSHRERELLQQEAEQMSSQLYPAMKKEIDKNK